MAIHFTSYRLCVAPVVAAAMLTRRAEGKISVPFTEKIKEPIEKKTYLW